MKITYSTHKPLELLKEKNLSKMLIIEHDRIGINTIFPRLKIVFNNNLNAFTSSINAISNTFAEAALMAQHKLFDLYLNIYKNPEEEGITLQGTFMYNQVVMMCNLKGKSEQTILVFHRSGPLVYAFHEINGQITLDWNSKHYGTQIDENNDIYFMLALIFPLFKNYARMETKLLPAGKKTKDISGKYINDTNSDVIVLDSRWFTTLVKSDGFKVRGHFRLQPKKVAGSWTRELIWIDEFEKSGYTAPARMLNEQIEIER